MPVQVQDEGDVLWCTEMERYISNSEIGEAVSAPPPPFACMLTYLHIGSLASLHTTLMLTILVEAADKSCLASLGAFLFCDISFLRSRYYGMDVRVVWRNL